MEGPGNTQWSQKNYSHMYNFSGNIHYEGLLDINVFTNYYYKFTLHDIRF